MTVEVRDVRGFDQVRFRGPGILKIIQGDTESLTIHAPSYVMQHVQSDVADGELQLGYRSPKVVSLRVRREVISYSLALRELRGIIVAGVGRVVVPDLDNDVVKVQIMGSGQVNLEHVTADRLEVSISGAGAVKARGDVEAQFVTLSGAGLYHAQQLISDFAHVKVTGAGIADVSVSEDLDVVISGDGQVTYAGYPEVIKRISGAGKLRRRRRNSRLPKNGEEHG